jgi:hypothetical protein
MKDSNVPPDDEHEWVKLIEAPRVLKATFVDGQRMANDVGYNHLARASQLGVDKLEHRPGSPERKEMEREQRFLEGHDIGQTTRVDKKKKEKKK